MEQTNDDRPRRAFSPGVKRHRTLDDLTPRELEVLQLLAIGNTNREIAGSLYITEKTAEDHVKHITRKLQARNRTQAVVVAHRRGLVFAFSGGDPPPGHSGPASSPAA